MKSKVILIYTGFVLLALSLSACANIKKFIYEGFARDDSQQPKKVLASLQIKPGMFVADVGAGAGYFTFHFAKVVGATGKVYAVDIDETMLDYLREKVLEKKLDNVEVIEATLTDARLPAARLDLIFLCNTYHHISNRIVYFRGIKKALKPNGRLAIIDRLPGSFLSKHTTSVKVINSELKKAGYRLDSQYKYLKKQNFTIFVPISPGD